MRRSGHSARCALITKRGRWELRVLIDHDLLLEERCDGAADAFSVAERWKEQSQIPIPNPHRKSLIRSLIRLHVEPP
jgi:hypothetical protein